MTHKSISVAVAAYAAPLARSTVAAEAAPAASGYARSIQVSGRTWLVKTGFSGPGPNTFSDAPDNVWVDAQGRLHLRITQRDGRWYCPEVVATESLGYGTYRFDVQGPLGDLDPNVVLGLFTWNDDPAYDHRELDVELARWGNPLAPNGQFTLHPNTPSVQRFTFSQPIDTTRGVYSIAWRRDRVTFGSLARSTSKPASRGRLGAEHTFTEAIPPAGGEHARINLWLSEGRPPTDAREVEVLIRRFDFAPWASAPAP